MTIIAWDGYVLAWDSRATAGDRKHRVKKHRDLKDGRTVVVAGEIRQLPKVAKLLDGNKLPDVPATLVENATFVVYDNGRVWEYDSTQAKRVRGIEAWGSGQEYALGCMYSSTNAIKACLAAIKYSATCGGRIHSRG